MRYPTGVPRGRGNALLLGLLLVGGAIGATAARAEAPSSTRAPASRSRVAELELSESEPGKAVQTSRWRVELTDRYDALVETHAGSLAYQTRLRLDPTTGQGGVLHCGLKRTDARNDSHNLHLTLSGAVEAGRRVSLVKVAGPSGSALEVFATLR